MAIYVLQEVWRLGVKKLKLFTDSKLMASQFGGTYKARNERMTAYLDVLQAQASHFTKLEVILKTRSGLRHVYSFVYLVPTITGKSSILITINRAGASICKSVTLKICI